MVDCLENLKQLVEKNVLVVVGGGNDLLVGILWCINSRFLLFIQYQTALRKFHRTSSKGANRFRAIYFKLGFGNRYMSTS